LLLDCARERPESKVKKKQKVRAAAVVLPIYAQRLFPLLGMMVRYLIGFFPTSRGNSDQSEQN
jgi:hypothetical protein